MTPEAAALIELIKTEFETVNLGQKYLLTGQNLWKNVY